MIAVGAGAILEFISGILGVRGKIKGAKGIAITILVMSLISLILSIVMGSFQWTSLIGLVLPILFLIGCVLV